MKKLINSFPKSWMSSTSPLASQTQETIRSEECSREFPLEWRWIQGFMKGKFEQGRKLS